MQVTVNGCKYEVELWKRGDPVLTGDDIAIDTETHMLELGKAVKPVIQQICVHHKRIVHIVDYKDMDVYNLDMFSQNMQSRFVFHNAAFDLHVMGLDDPEKVYLKQALLEGRVVDTGIRFLLHRLAEGSENIQWNLNLACQKILHFSVEKPGEVRLSFEQDVILTEAQIEYAAKDPAATAQLAIGLGGPRETEQIHLLGHIALSDISRRGLLVDREYLREMKASYTKQIEKLDFVLEHWGYVKGRKGNKKIQQKILALVEEVTGMPLPRTESGQIQADKEVMQRFGDNLHPFLKAYQEKEHADKMVQTYMNEEFIGADGRVHTRFTPLVKTGRTSSSKPNLQNIPRKGGIRGIYIAPPGYAIYACDYKQLELCSLSESNFLRFGSSKMRELINDGLDVHTWFGEHIMRKFGGNEHDGIDYRQMAKAANFGLPGGLGAATFQAYAYGTYGVMLTEDQCKELKVTWLDTFPEMVRHLKPLVDSQFNDMYVAQTTNGRRRSNASFCAACNYWFQGLAADGAKMALWFLYLDRYRVVNFVHDEVLVELKLDHNLQNHIKHIDYLMISGMEHVIKNVNIQVEGALMTKWYKEAEPVYDRNGDLMVWDPEIAKRIKQ